MQPIETARLIIRNFSVDDSPALHRMICQYQASEFAAYDHPWPTSPEKIRKVAEWFAGGDVYFAVCLREDRQFIGFVCLNEERTEDSLQYNLGYVFDAGHRRRGYAFEACRTVIRRAFQKLHADRLITATAAGNVPSCRLLEKLGFRITGQSICSFRQREDGQPLEFLGNEYVLTKIDWAAQVEPIPPPA